MVYPARYELTTSAFAGSHASSLFCPLRHANLEQRENLVVTRLPRQRKRGCPLWVKRVGFVMSAVGLVYPKQQTFPDPVGTSHLCQELTYRRPASLSPSRSCLAAIRSAVPKPSVKRS